jgi:ubiquinone/menaquinone biosynthesis C-methylase UbiE
LQLQAGDTVVDLGCGPGSNFGLLSSRVGEPGRVVGYDLSEEMVKAARKRAESNGWTNIEVVRADVTEPLPQETFDAAVATLTLSTIPNPEVVVQHAYDGLVPGGRLLVLDARLPGGAVGRAVNPLLARLLRWSSAWNRASSERIRPALRDTFDDVVWTARVPPGLAYVLVVSKAP